MEGSIPHSLTTVKTTFKEIMHVTHKTLNNFSLLNLQNLNRERISVKKLTSIIEYKHVAKQFHRKVNLQTKTNKFIESSGDQRRHVRMLRESHGKFIENKYNSPDFVTLNPYSFCLRKEDTRYSRCMGDIPSTYIVMMLTHCSISNISKDSSRTSCDSTKSSNHQQIPVSSQPCINCSINKGTESNPNEINIEKSIKIKKQMNDDGTMTIQKQVTTVKTQTIKKYICTKNMDSRSAGSALSSVPNKQQESNVSRKSNHITLNADTKEKSCEGVTTQTSTHSDICESESHFVCCSLTSNTSRQTSKSEQNVEATNQARNAATSPMCKDQCCSTTELHNLIPIIPNRRSSAPIMQNKAALYENNYPKESRSGCSIKIILKQGDAHPENLKNKRKAKNGKRASSCPDCNIKKKIKKSTRTCSYCELHTKPKKSSSDCSTCNAQKNKKATPNICPKCKANDSQGQSPNFCSRCRAQDNIKATSSSCPHCKNKDKIKKQSSDRCPKCKSNEAPKQTLGSCPSYKPKNLSSAQPSGGCPRKAKIMKDSSGVCSCKAKYLQKNSSDCLQCKSNKKYSNTGLCSKCNEKKVASQHSQNTATDCLQCKANKKDSNVDLCSKCKHKKASHQLQNTSSDCLQCKANKKSSRAGLCSACKYKEKAFQKISEMCPKCKDNELAQSRTLKPEPSCPNCQKKYNKQLNKSTCKCSTYEKDLKEKKSYGGFAFENNLREGKSKCKCASKAKEKENNAAKDCPQCKKEGEVSVKSSTAFKSSQDSSNQTECSNYTDQESKVNYGGFVFENNLREPKNKCSCKAKQKQNIGITECPKCKIKDEGSVKPCTACKSTQATDFVELKKPCCNLETETSVTSIPSADSVCEACQTDNKPSVCPISITVNTNKCAGPSESQSSESQLSEQSCLCQTNSEEHKEQPKCKPCCNSQKNSPICPICSEEMCASTGNVNKNPLIKGPPRHQCTFHDEFEKKKKLCPVCSSEKCASDFDYTKPKKKQSQKHKCNFEEPDEHKSCPLCSNENNRKANKQKKSATCPVCQKDKGPKKAETTESLCKLCEITNAITKYLTDVNQNKKPNKQQTCNKNNEQTKVCKFEKEIKSSIYSDSNDSFMSCCASAASSTTTCPKCPKSKNLPKCPVKPLNQPKRICPAQKISCPSCEVAAKVSLESGKISECTSCPKMKDASTMTSPSARYDVRTISCFSAPPKKKRKTCTCKSDTFVLLQDTKSCR